VCRVSCISRITRGISGKEEAVSHAQVKDLPSKSAQLRSGYISTGDTHIFCDRGQLVWSTHVWAHSVALGRS
jgi:hypothetical protein